MEKEVLTKKSCLKDIAVPQWVIWLVAYLYSWIPRAVFALVAEIVADITGMMPFFFMQYAIAWLIGVGLAVVHLIKGYKLRRMIRRDKVFLVEEKLIGKDLQEDTHSRLHRYSAYRGPGIITTLVFPFYGEYKAVTYGSGTSHYKWSNEHKTGARGLYFDGEVGDLYYLVVTKDKEEKLLMIYSTKRFALAEEDFEKRGERYYFK